MWCVQTTKMLEKILTSIASVVVVLLPLFMANHSQFTNPNRELANRENNQSLLQRLVDRGEMVLEVTFESVPTPLAELETCETNTFEQVEDPKELEIQNIERSLKLTHEVINPSPLKRSHRELAEQIYAKISSDQFDLNNNPDVFAIINQIDTPTNQRLTEDPVLRKQTILEILRRRNIQRILDFQRSLPNNSTVDERQIIRIERTIADVKLNLSRHRQLANKIITENHLRTQHVTYQQKIEIVQMLRKKGILTSIKNLQTITNQGRLNKRELAQVINEVDQSQRFKYYYERVANYNNWPQSR